MSLIKNPLRDKLPIRDASYGTRLKISVTIASLAVVTSLWLVTVERYYIGLICLPLLLLFASGTIRSQPAESLLVFLIPLAAFRTVIYLITPSMVGMDPDKVAVGVERIISTGSTNAISELTFYSIASVTHIYAAQTGLVIGTGGRGGLVAFPVFLTVIPALSAGCICQRLSLRSSSAVAAGILAATAGVVAAWALQPIPQGMAVGLIGFLLVSTTVFISVLASSGWARIAYLLPVILATVLLVFTHKAALVFLLVAFVICIVMVGRTSRSESVTRIGIIVGFLTSIQVFYVTDFAWSLINLIILPSIGGAAFTTGSIELTAARPVLGGLSGAVLNNLHWLLLGICAGLGWLILAIKEYRFPTTVGRVVLAFGAGSALMSAVAVVGPGIAYTRILLLAVLPFAVLIGVLINRSPASAATAIVVFLIFFQVTAPMASPDHPAQFRQYLTSEEVTAKQTIGTITDNVSTDIYYARELSTISPSKTYQPGEGVALESGWNPLGRPLFNENLSSVSSVVVLRDISRYRMSGTQVLVYNPREQLAHERSVVYQSGNVTAYW